MTTATFERAAIAGNSSHQSSSTQAGLLHLAKQGDRDALGRLFDAVAYDVYSQAFLESRSRLRAEALTDWTLSQVPSVLRRSEVQSVAAVRSRLLYLLAGRLSAQRRQQEVAARLADTRELVRHIFLAASASAVAVAGLIAAI